MLKKILSLVLFATMLFTMTAVASAAEDDDSIVETVESIGASAKVASGVYYVAVYNLDNNIDKFATVTLAETIIGSEIGILVPGTLDKNGAEIENKLIIRGDFNVMSKTDFDVAIVFDGIVDIEAGDALALDGSYVGASRVGTTLDGMNSVLTATFSVPDGVAVGGTKTYKVYFMQDGGARKFDFSFTVQFIDTNPDDLDFGADVDADYVDLLDVDWLVASDSLISEDEVLDGDDDYDYDYTVANAVVTASRLNIRAAASVDSSIIGKLDNGDGVFVGEVDGNWYLLLDTDGDPVGYVYSKYISIL